MPQFSIREYDHDRDFNFIVNSWVKSYEISEWAKFMRPGLYRVYHRKQIESMLADRNDYRVTCRVAVNNHNKDQIYGYIVGSSGELPCLHFIYCKKIFRGIGVGQELFDSLGYAGKLEYSHFSPGLQRLLKGRGVYNPYRFFI